MNMVQVVFVDDDKIYAECIQEYFSQIYRSTKVQIKTYLVTNDPQTMEKVQNTIIEEKPQVLFIDLGLPHIDGCKLIEEIKERAKHYYPITVLTSAMPDVHIHKGIANYVLMKTNDYEIFKEIIDLMVDFSGDIENVLSIEGKLEQLEEKHKISYHEKKTLHQILTKFRQSKKNVDINYDEMKEVTNKSYGAILQLLYRLKKKN
jgi:CheY-like chemotaxis protein